MPGNEFERFFEQLLAGPKMSFEEPVSGRIIELLFGYMEDHPFAILLIEGRLACVMPREAIVAAMDGWGLLDRLEEQDFDDSQVFKDFINDIETKEEK